MDSYKPVLEKTMPLYPDIDLLDMSPAELIPYIDGMYEGILDNYEAFRRALEYPAPMFVSMPEVRSDGTIRFAWDASYSYQGRPVTYNVRVYEDPRMQDLVFEQTGIEQTEYISGQSLPEGTYYLKVTAVDSQGNEQFSLEHVDGDNLFVFGLLEFEIGR